MKRLLLGVLILGMVAACSSTPKKEEGAAVEDRKPGAGESVERPGVKPAETKPLTEKPFAGSPLKDPNNILSKRSVYFDFDSNLVKDEYKPIVSAHARYLQQNSGASMRIEGNTDERGSREYNVALGQRRADGVKKLLLLLGAREDQVEAVSLGEEKPKAQGNSEEAYAQNRRCDILYKGEY